MSDDLVASLVAIWREALQDDALDAESDFAEFGGTSRTAVRIQAMIRSELGKDVDILDILDYPTPVELCPAVVAAPDWAADDTEAEVASGRDEWVDAGTVELVRDPARANAYVLLMHGAAQSFVDLDDPTHLEFGYMRHMAQVVDADTPPRAGTDILHLGGGALTLPRYFAATRVARQVAVEADGSLVALVRRELPLSPAAQVDVQTGDARAVLTETPDDRYDVIIADVYTALTVPAHILAVEFVAAAARVLRPGGRYVANIADGGPLATVRSQVANLRSVFPHVCLLAPDEILRGRRSGNVVLAASDAPLPIDTLVRRLAADPSRGRVIAGDDLSAFLADAPGAPDTPPFIG